jgi:hypothetical protein
LQAGTPLAHTIVPSAHTPGLPVGHGCVAFSSQPSAFWPSQSTYPGLQLSAHTPAAQDATPFAVPQALPQLPQLVVDTVVSISHPFVGLLSQSANPLSQVPNWQLEFTHNADACAYTQVFPQLPQFCASVDVFVSHPLFALPSQSCSGGLQDDDPQTPVVHVAVLPGTCGQTVLQSPQWAVSPLTKISHPSFLF